ncbi:MAG: hypothetical protein NTY98_05990, partial [Verrucomicrobia bacterium]|nr:hypothetical protein [Verrucomicrobiota bacterium]
ASSADGAASASTSTSTPPPTQSTPTPEAGTPPRRRPRWRLIAGALLTFGLCLGAALLVKREHQRQSALTLLEDCGCKGKAWHSPWGRVPSSETLDWDELRSRTFLYPDVIVVPKLQSGLAGEIWAVRTIVPHEENESADDRENEDTDEHENEITDDREKDTRVKELRNDEALQFLAALEVLRPKMLIVGWSAPQAPAFWHRLSQVTSLEGLMVRAGGSMFDDRSLQEITRLPHLSVLMLTRTRITDAGLACLDTCPQLKTLSLDGSQVTREGVLACLRRCPNLQIKLNGEGVSRR